MKKINIVATIALLMTLVLSVGCEKKMDDIKVKADETAKKGADKAKDRAAKVGEVAKEGAAVIKDGAAKVAEVAKDGAGVVKIGAAKVGVASEDELLGAKKVVKEGGTVKKEVKKVPTKPVRKTN